MSYYIYMMTDDKNNVLYIGVTNDLIRRIGEHKSDILEGYTKRYQLHKLVYFEEYSDVNDAIAREKQLKGWCRAKKNALVKSQNPKWEELLLR